MKKIFAVLLSVCLIVLLCACGEGPAPAVLAENERILLAMPQETGDEVVFRYKVITDAEDIGKILYAVNDAPKTFIEENADAASKQVLARIRLSDGIGFVERVYVYLALAVQAHRSSVGKSYARQHLL